MSKTRKWHVRAIHLAVALALTLGLLMVPAAVAAPESEAAASPATTFRFYDQNSVPQLGEVCWDSTKSQVDNDSVKLSHNLTAAGGVGLEFTPAPGVTLADLDNIGATPEWSFWHYIPSAVGATNWVQLGLRFTSCYNDDPNGAGHVDVTLMPLQNYTGTDGWLKQTVEATDKPAWAYYGNAADGTAISKTSGAGVEDLKGIEGYINIDLGLITAESASDWELTTVILNLWEPVDRTCYIDDIKIAGTTYAVEHVGPDYYLEPDIAYNVKTAQETFTLMGPCGPTAYDVDVDSYSWSVEKGCGVPGGGPVHFTGGGDQDNSITVRLNTKGDCHVCVVIDIDMDGDEELIEVCAEKKWGDIHCTELTKGALVGGKCCVTETVLASFLWEGCVVEVELPADGAVVDWWLMHIDAQAAVTALETALGVDPCDDDGGCGVYTPGFFSYDIDASGTIDPVTEVFDSPREAMLAIYAQFEFLPAVKANNFIAPNVTPPLVSDLTHETTTTGVDGKTAVTVTLAAPTSAILATLTDYPIDKHGENTVCVQHETWVVIPPPFYEKLPNILWAGEKDVIEWRLDVTSWDFLTSTQAVVFYLEDPSVGTFETLNPDFPPPSFPWPGFAIRDTAWGLVEANPCDDSYVARAVLHSDKQGKANVIAQYLEFRGVLGSEQSGAQNVTGYWEIVSQQGFLVYFLAFEEVELVNLDEDVDNDEAWTEAGETTSVLDVGEEGLLRLRVKGFFEDPVMKSPRAAEPQDLDGDGTTDIILPAGRWVLPDDYPTIAMGKLLWDMMDTPIDDIVSCLDEDGDEVETLGVMDEILVLGLPAAGPKAEFGAYGDEACFESPLYDATLTAAQRWAAYLAGVVSFGPVIGPFSKLEPVNADGTAWAAFAGTTQIQPEVPADNKQVDAFKNAAGNPLRFGCRTTVVPDGSITEEDANMPPAEILFVLTDGAGDLTDVNKADLYYRDADCVFGLNSVDGEVYTNPYYWQEIPANLIIPPMYGSGLAGYEWDSWGTDITIDGPYRFWDGLDVWTSDELIAMNILDLTEVPPVVKVYTDNHGEAWVEFEQESFDGSVIQAIATYPYLIGDHLPLVSNPVIKLSENLKRVELYVDDLDPVDPIRKMVYVFVRNYDGTPADCELVDWIIDGPYGIFEALLEGTCDACANACYPADYWDCEDCYIWLDGRSAANCTREMTAAEITEFAAEVAALSDEVGEEADDYAIAGLVVLSSHLEDVDVSIKIHDCWEGTVVEWAEDIMVEFGNVVPEEGILDYYRCLYGDCTDVSTSELLVAITDWAAGTIPSGCPAALTTTQLLTLIGEWAS